ncbi:methylenetetrahydrofolate reductase [Saccharopolyspora cebuensis]|uniref:Methylenetetrahydrofolate reductase n=1 Tax=Saccharopolyspora cebuensis TaxID=418759 RepID=A0ABV4CMT8_9PSEU
MNTAVAALLQDFSLEMTGKDAAEFDAARGALPPGTRVNVTFLGTEDSGQRFDAVRRIARAGLVPVPHLAARRLESRAALEEFLAGVRDAGAGPEVFVVGGDPAEPLGPYEDAADVLETGLLPRYGVRHVGIGGYPEGHPAIDDAALRTALKRKCTALDEQGLGGSITTQFGFDVDPVLSWLAALRDRGVDLPVRIGVPGPAGVKRLLRYATRFGVSTGAGIARKYGLSLTNLMGTAGPDRFVRDLAARHDPRRHGEIALHFYTFGGLRATADWITRARAEG